MTSRALVVDGLNCAPVTREQMQRTLKGGVTALNLTSVRPPHDFNTAMSDLARTLAVIADNADIATIPRSVRDIEQAKADGKLAIILGAQNSVLVEEDVELLRILERIGFRILQPTYMELNRFGGGVLAKGGDPGLSPLGERWVALMNELRMLIDLSHVGYQTAAGVLARSKRPVIFSHSNARALCDSLRNIPDELALAAARTGGTVGATLWPPMVRHDRRPSVDDWAEQVAYFINLVGEDHVAFGSDLSENRYKSDDEWQKSFGPRGIYPEVTAVLGPWFTFENRLSVGFESMAHVPNLAEALSRRGIGGSVIDKVMGGNLIRVYREVWGE
ncbi:membrane dipeptidase [Alsobacter sp. SYSU M60028]|uniref:Membrane dipeptidase n=1 Tax=Alsobacter ponti TaxID=2962936 RepID=A0ABT1LHR6_9HYPH|nr:membrane dipeptidase [Alsobacter ponti]MCP8941052.1 membrane dipeptidase [Alsobacter ponti]